MAIGFDVASTGISGTPWNHTCVAGTTILIVDIGDFKGADTESVTGITYDSGGSIQNFTLFGSHAVNVARSSTWYLLAPHTGSALAITVTSGSTVACVAHSWTGTDTSSPLALLDARGDFTSLHGQPTSNSVTAASTSYILGHTGNLTDTLTVNAGMTPIGNATSGGFHCGSAYKAGTGGATTIGWTNYTSDDRWAVLTLELKAPAAAAATPRLRSLMGVGF